jgi:hypothetical protein
MKRLTLIPLAVLLAAAAFPYGVRIESFDVSPEGSAFVLRWQTDLEEAVDHFEVLRKTPGSNDEFVKVHEVEAHGIGRPYVFRDDQVFKAGAEQLVYQLEAVFDNGTRQVLHVQALNYTSTAVRRTWGSIKAMFQ